MSGRLPDFLIAGTMKAGTSSLANWLGAREDVHLAPGKELHFFNSDANYKQGAEWYSAKLAAPAGVPLAFEATPLYSFYPAAIERIAQMLPEVKVIVCLRDPVTRAYSHYRHFWDRRGWERRAFTSIVDRELSEGDPEAPGEIGLDPYAPPAARYVAQGLYLLQLQRLEQAIGRDRLHVVLMEDDIQGAPADAFHGVCDFLGIPREPIPPEVGQRFNAHFEYRPMRLWRLLVRHRVLERLPDRLGHFIAVDLMRKETKPAPMPEEARTRLKAFYAPYNAALADYLGRDLSRWS